VSGSPTVGASRLRCLVERLGQLRLDVAGTRVVYEVPDYFQQFASGERPAAVPRFYVINDDAQCIE
jgi:hypothetical protein